MSNKTYIGKGKAGNYNSIRAIIRLNAALGFIYDKEGEHYLTFFINPLQESDNFGRTHTAYCLDQNQQPEAVPTPEEVAASEPNEPILEKKRKKKAASV